MSDQKDSGPKMGLNVDRLAAALNTARGRAAPQTVPTQPKPPASPDTDVASSAPDQVPPLHLDPDLTAPLPPLILTQPVTVPDTLSDNSAIDPTQPPPVRSPGLFDREGRLARSRARADGDVPGQSSVRVAEAPEKAAPAAARSLPEAETDRGDMVRFAARQRPVSPPRMGPALLTLSGVQTDIGRYHILDGVDLEVPIGGVTMLLGRNGAGKTTTLRTIMGLWQARAGRITFGGEDMTHWPTARIARAGIGYVPEDMGVFGKLTVAENMRLGVVSGAPSRDRLDWILTAFPPLKTFWKLPAGHLSGGQKQMLSIARTMVVKRRLYLIDEPSKGLAPAIVATLAEALRDLKAQGASILMVEQNFEVARALGDTCAVMEDGHCVWAGGMTDLVGDADLQDRLLGMRTAMGEHR